MPCRKRWEGLTIASGGYRIIFRVIAADTIELDYADTRDIVYEAFRSLRILREI